MQLRLVPAVPVAANRPRPDRAIIRTRAPHDIGLEPAQLLNVHPPIHHQAWWLRTPQSP